MKLIFAIILSASITAYTAHSEMMKSRDTFISETAQEACIEYGEQYGICPELLMAIIETESGGQADAYNGGCHGVMQISTKWHAGRIDKLGATDIYDERSNILVGADYLAELIKEYQDVGTVLMVFHGESDSVQKSGNGDISDYARKILERSEELERIHGK